MNVRKKKKEKKRSLFPIVSNIKEFYDTNLYKIIIVCITVFFQEIIFFLI